MPPAPRTPTRPSRLPAAAVRMALLLLGAWAPALAAQDPGALARRILESGRYQAELPPYDREPSVEGGRTATARDPDRAPDGAPTAPRGHLDWLLWAAVAGAVVLAALLLVRRSRTRRDFELAPAGATRDTPPPSDPFDPGEGPLHDARRLAGEGRHAEAIRHLLHGTLAALAHAGRVTVRPSLTGRAACRAARLDDADRALLRTLVDAVEQALFAGRHPGDHDFDRCARAFTALRRQGAAT